MEKLYEYVGVFHIHTTESDGTKGHEEIIRIAKRSGLDFIVFTDHMSIKRPQLQGWHDGVLVIVGYELQDNANKNHYLVLGIDRLVGKNMTAMDYVRKVKEFNGIGIIAHPDEVRQNPDYPPYEWNEWNTLEFDGLEVWNHLSAWMEEIVSKRQYILFVKPRAFLLYPPERTLKRWDELNKIGHYVGIGSVDAHAHKYRFGPFWIRIFPYKVAFKSIRSHLLLKEPLPRENEKAVLSFLQAVRKGNIFISNYHRGDARGFRFIARGKSGKYVLPGEAMELKDSPYLFSITPRRALFRLIKDGSLLTEREGNEFNFEVVEKGIYRMELVRDNAGWIYTNPIWII